MAFNKAREEYKWKKWKEAEEKKMRELGVSETVIAELREYDWNCFKKERTYHTWQTPDSDVVDEQALSDDSMRIDQPVSAREFIRAIDDKELRAYLKEMDALTMRIILLKIFGYSTAEIAEILGITTHVIYQRMKRLRKKLKKFLI